MLANIFDDDFDCIEEKLESAISAFSKNQILNYFNKIKNDKGLTIMETNDEFPSEQDLKFIKEAELGMVLDYCYPLLDSKLPSLENKKEESHEVLGKDVKIVLNILTKLSKNNIPKSFSAGMLYYEIRHCYN